MRKSHRIRNYTIVLIIGILVVGAAAWWLGWRNANNATNTAAKTTSALPTAQAGYNGTTKSTPKPLDTEANQGGAVDTHGAITDIPPSSQWTSSSSDKITLYTPTNDSTLKPGATIEGAAQVSKVNFTLVDNSAGVIAQGSISVHNGKFSGSLQFTPQGKTGVLKVFSTDSSGREHDFTNVDVKF